MISTKRHVHSPRVRRVARDHGVALDGLVGSGPNGRVTTADVLRAGDHVAGSRQLTGIEIDALTGGVAHAPPAGQAMAVVEVDVTRVAKGSHALLAAVIEAAVPALRRALSDRGPDVGIRVVVHEGGRSRTIRDADHLSMTGLLHALEVAADGSGAGIDGGPRHGSRPEDRSLAVHAAGGDGFLFESLPMVVGDLAALSVGAPVERVAVIVQPDGERGIGVRTFVHLALTYDEQLSRAGVVKMLAAVRTRLEGLGRVAGGGAS
jgi:2-oxoglutarate dehydrogenase E2 component (dihydrolipoamide succinyltransferase)